MTPCLLLHKQRHSLHIHGKYLTTTLCIHRSCSLCSVYCSMWLVCWYKLHASQQLCMEEQGFTISGNWFPSLWKSLDEAKWTYLAITQNFIERVNSILCPQWNQLLNRTAHLCPNPGPQSWFPGMSLLAHPSGSIPAATPSKKAFVTLSSPPEVQCPKSMLIMELIPSYLRGFFGGGGTLQVLFHTINSITFHCL